MSFTLLAATSNPAGGATVSASSAWFLDTVLQAACVNPQGNLATPCRVQLLLSNDNALTFVVADTSVFDNSPGKTSYQSFTLADYATSPVTPTQKFAGTLAAAVPVANLLAHLPNWTHFMLRFSGNTGSAVTVSALADSGALSGGGGGAGITALTGDGTAGGTGSVALLVTKTGGALFAPSATTDTTNAANIASGTIAAARLPVMVASGASHAIGAVPDPGASSGATKFLREDASWQVPPGSGSGTVTTASVASANGLAGTVANPTTTPVFTLSTTVTGLLKGNGTVISAATPGTDYLVTLPNPSSSTLGGVQSAAQVLKNWIYSISTTGVPLFAQPAFTDLSGSIAVSQIPTTGQQINQHLKTILSVTQVAGNITLNLAASDWFTSTLTANATVVISNPPSGTNQIFRVELVQAASGGPYTVAWFSGITWMGTAAPTMPTTASHKITAVFEVTGSGAYNGYYGGEGGVAASGTPPAGSDGQTQYNAAGVFGAYTMSGDATLVASTGVITVTKTNNVAFAASATTDTTVATNISSGNLPAARLTTNLSAAMDTVLGSTAGGFGIRGASAWLESTNFTFDNTNTCPQFTAITVPATPLGRLWYAAGQGTFNIGRASGRAHIGGCIFSCLSCAQILSFTSSTSLLTTPTTTNGGSLTIPANTLAVGNVLRWAWAGIWNATGTPTITPIVKLNGVTVLAGLTATITLSAQAGSPPFYTSYGWMSVRAIGASAAVGGVMQLLMANPGGSTLSATMVPGGSTPVDTVTFASNTDALFDLQFACSASSSSNNFQTKSFALFLDN